MDSATKAKPETTSNIKRKSANKRPTVIFNPRLNPPDIDADEIEKTAGPGVAATISIVIKSPINPSIVNSIS